MTSAEARTKLYRFCSYQERCHQEVEAKLRELRVPGIDWDEIIHHLIIENFLNEERFARAYASGKFRLKGWGRLRIRQELEQRNLSAFCVKAGLSEILEDDYRNALRTLLLKKKETITAPNLYSLRDKISKFAIGRGFEPELVWIELKAILPG